MARERVAHLQQVGAYRFMAGRGVKRAATVVPAPLRYWQYQPAGPVALLVVVLVIGGWLTLFGVIGGWSELRGEIPLALAAGAAVLALSTRRLTVTDHAFSMDVAGTRTDPARVVPLVMVREVRTTPLPEGWPEPTGRGGWWPGRTKVGVRILADDGREERAIALWVRGPEEFATSLGVRLTG